MTLFQMESEFLKGDKWPYRNYVYVKRDEEVGWVYSANRSTVYPVDGGYPLYKYESVEAMLEDGWHVD